MIPNILFDDVYLKYFILMSITIQFHYCDPIDPSYSFAILIVQFIFGPNEFLYLPNYQK